MTRFRLLWAALLAVFLAACSEDDAARRADAPFDAMPRRHIFAPPAGEVRAVPPHAIRSAGVGPYLLGATLEEILGILPHGPRVELLQIQGLLDYSLVRIEADALVIGVERFEGVTFVAVLDSDIARTEEGVGVGTRESELRAALGPSAPDARRARDPRVLAFASLPNTQFVVEDGSVVAAIVRDGPGEAASEDSDEAADRAADEPAEAAAEAPAEACADTGAKGADVAEPLEDAPRDAIAQAAQIAPHRRSQMRVQSGCFDPPGKELVVTARDRLAVVEGEGDELRLRGAVDIEGLVYAAPVRLGAEGRDAIVAVSSHRSAEELKVEIAALEVGEDGPAIADRHVPYRLPSHWATWVGAELNDTELLVGARAVGKDAAHTLEISGLYVHRVGRQTRNIAPLEAKTWAPELGAGRSADERSAQDEAGEPTADEGETAAERGGAEQPDPEGRADAAAEGAPPRRGDASP